MFFRTVSLVSETGTRTQFRRSTVHNYEKKPNHSKPIQSYFQIELKLLNLKKRMKAVPKKIRIPFENFVIEGNDEENKVRGKESY